jgi:dTDP-glucose pyrophosphorylase
MWGIIPAAGIGSRIQPLAFSKELLPIGSRFDDGVERPRAVTEYLIERMVLGGATRICFVIAPGKSDILEYFGGEVAGVPVCYAVQPHAAGLCDAVFRAAAIVPADDTVVIGLPDTVWFPEDGLTALPDDELSFLLFPVAKPELFDAVVTDAEGWVQQILVKRLNTRSRWIWGAIKMPGAVFHHLRQLWHSRDRQDEYLGTLVNAYLEDGGRALGVRAGEAYVDVGTLNGYREATSLLSTLSGSREPGRSTHP